MTLNPGRWPLGVRVGAALVLFALIPMAILAQFSLAAGREGVETAQLEAVEGAAGVASASVRQYLAGTLARADQLGTRPDVVAHLEANGAGDTLVLAGEADAPDIMSVVVANRDGIITAAVPQELEGSDVAGEWFAEARTGRLVVGRPQPGAPGTMGSVTVAAPGRNPGAAVQGVVALEVRGEDLLAALAETPLAAAGQALLTDPAGTVIAARDSRLVGQPLAALGLGDLAAAIDTEPSGTLIGVDLAGRGEQVAAWDAASSGITAVVLEPRSVFLGPIDRLRTTSGILLGVVGAVAALAAVVIARRLTRPVKALTTAARQVEQGTAVDPGALETAGRSHDDVGQLARVFARMASQVEARERTLRAEVRALKVEIDQERRRQAVEEVTETDFFRDLQQRAADMRRRAKGDT